MSLGRAVSAFGISFASLLAAGGAFAQANTFTLDRAQLSGAPDDGFMVHRPFMDKETRFYGNFALGYAHAPLRKDATTSSTAAQNRMEDPIQGQFLVYPSVGVQIMGRLGFNLHLPFVPYQFTGADPASAGVGQGGMTGTNAAMGDMRIDARGFLYESDDQKLRLGVEGGFTLATGTETAFGGDRGSTALLLATGEYNFGDFFVSGHLGPHFRPVGSIGGTEGDLVVGNELRYAFGAFLPLRHDEVRLGVEIWGSTGIESVDGQNTFFTQRNTTFEWMAQGRFLLDARKRVFANVGGGTRLSAGYGSADFRVLGSIGSYWTLNDTKSAAPPPTKKIVSRAEHYEEDSDGDGYPDGVDNCPDDKEDGKEPKAYDGCPAEADADSDGIPDRLDKCPGEAEDFDKIEDTDGCPESDADHDQVLDSVDRCPKEPGPPNKDATLNGCPTMTKLSADGTIDLLKPIEFNRGKASIMRESYPIIEEVVTFLKARPDVRVSVNGHTDNVGSADYNRKLSEERAVSVKEQIVKGGIDASRLEAKGYGPDKPLGENETPEGRAKNRRVEFVILAEDRGDAKDGDDW